MADDKQIICPCCLGTSFAELFHYAAPPTGEIRYAGIDPSNYDRAFESCLNCGHCLARNFMDLSGLYSGDYVTSTYGESGIRAAFDRITALDPTRSDNVGRAKRVDGFLRKYLMMPNNSQRQPVVLDVGSGLGVFVHRMKESGWACVALDPDPRAVEHAQTHIGVTAVCNDFMRSELSQQFDLVTFNKVLEHVPDPVAMLKKACTNVAARGLIYVEVPDAEAAARAGAGREEFFIEHLHVFSAASLVMLGRRSGLEVIGLERLQEPSSKFTLYAFFKLIQ